MHSTNRPTRSAKLGRRTSRRGFTRRTRHRRHRLQQGSGGQPDGVAEKRPPFFRSRARARIAKLFDPTPFVEVDDDVRSSDPLSLSTRSRIPIGSNATKRKSGLSEAVICGTGKIIGIEVSVRRHGFPLLRRSVGAAAGEKITRAIETGSRRGSPASSSAPPAARGCRKASIRSCRWRRRARHWAGSRRPACRSSPCSRTRRWAE